MAKHGFCLDMLWITSNRILAPGRLLRMLLGMGYFCGLVYATGARMVSHSEGREGDQGQTQRTLRIATIQMEPFVSLRYEPGLIANDRYQGLYIDLLRELAREADFSYQLYLVPDGKTGQTGDDGRWNGLIGELNKGNADLALAPIATTESRREQVAFTIPLTTVRISTLTRQSSANSILPYGVVVNSEAYFALRSDPQKFDSMRQTYGVIYINSVLEGLFRAREGEMRLLVNSQLADYYSDQEPCDLVGQEFYASSDLYFSLAVAAEGQLLDDVNAGLERLLLGTMLLERLEQTWLWGSCHRHGTLPTLSDSTTLLQTEADKVHLVITSVLVPPYLMRSHQHGVEYEGYIADLIRAVAQVVPFEYEWRIQRRVGKRRKDGSWTGMMGDLIDEDAHFAAAPFIPDKKAEPMISMSKPFLESTLSLLVQSPPGSTNLPILMVEDLLNQTNYDFGIIHKSRVAQRLKRSNLPLYKQLWKQLKTKDRENKILSLEDGMNRVRQGDFALLLESMDATYLSSRRPCDVLSLEQYLSVTNYAFTTKKNSALLDHLNQALLSLQEDGVLQALFHKWWNPEECLGVHDASPVDQYTSPMTTTTTSTTTTQPTSTAVPTLATLRPNFDFDLDALLGLSTDPPPLSEYGDYEEVEDDREDMEDMSRIFLTSPISAFTPIRPVTVQPSPTTATTPMPTTIPSTTTTLSTTTTITPFLHGADEEQPQTYTSSSNDEERTNDSISSTTISMLTTTKKRRNRTRRPGKRKNRKRKTTPMPPTSTIEPIIAQTPPRDRSHDLNEDINWFFVTHRPRPEDYEDYDNSNVSDNTGHDGMDHGFEIPEHNTYVIRNDDVMTVPSSTSASTVSVDSGSSSTPGGGTNKAVILVIVLQLLIFGWPATTPECRDNCSR